MLSMFSHGKSYSEMGFFAVTTAYSVAKRFVGPWLGTAAGMKLPKRGFCLASLQREV